MARQLEEKWRIILEEESNRSSNRCEGVNPWSQYKSNCFTAEPKHSIFLSAEVCLDTILNVSQPQLNLTACCNEFHPPALPLPRSETENKSMNQVPREECH